MRIRAIRGRASAAATWAWMVRMEASTSARMMAAARTAVIRAPRIPTTAHHRTIPRRCRRACTRPSTIPSTNCSWCRVVTSAATTRNPSLPLFSSLFLPLSLYLPGISRLFLVAFFLFLCFLLPALRNDLLCQESRRSISFIFFKWSRSVCRLQIFFLFLSWSLLTRFRPTFHKTFIYLYFYNYFPFRWPDILLIFEFATSRQQDVDDSPKVFAFLSVSLIQKSVFILCV